MANPLDKLVLFGAIAPYLPTSFLGRQEPSPLASLRGTKPVRFAHLTPQGGTHPVEVRGTGDQGEAGLSSKVFDIMESIEIAVGTGSRAEVVDLTAEAARFANGKGDGLLSVFVPHATAGVAIIETGAGSDRDLLAAIDDVLPAKEGKWLHRHGSPGHGRDHVVPGFISPSVTVPVLEGRLTLGTWQSIVLVDTNVDNHTRRVRLSFLSG